MADRDEIDFQFLTENCADILCSVGADHVILYISPSCFDILGWRPAEMIAGDLRQFILADDVAALEDLEAARRPDHATCTHVRLRFLKKDRASVWISINAKFVGDTAAGKPRQHVLCMRDITGRTALEEKLSALAMTDPLTGLWNRRAFDQALRREWKRVMRETS